MVPGLTERDCQAAELRRRDLVAQAAWRLPLPEPGSVRHGRPSLLAARRSLGAFLVSVGRRLQGGAELAPPVGSEPAVGLTVVR